MGIGQVVYLPPTISAVDILSFNTWCGGGEIVHSHSSWIGVAGFVSSGGMAGLVMVPAVKLLLLLYFSFDQYGTNLQLSSNATFHRGPF